jgi:hypothetical protein
MQNIIVNKNIANTDSNTSNRSTRAHTHSSVLSTYAFPRTVLTCPTPFVDDQITHFVKKSLSVSLDKDPSTQPERSWAFSTAVKVPANILTFCVTSVLVEFKGFWRWCITLRITGFHDLSIVRNSKYVLENTTFRKLDLFSSLGEGRDWC